MIHIISNKYSIVICLFLISWNLKAQNLVPNHNFENYTSCPTGYSDWPVTDWYATAFNISPDYYHECGAPDVGVPTNGTGFQESGSGSAYIGFFTYQTSNYVREFAQVQLSEPTIEGSCYNLSITYSPSEFGGTANGLGMALTNGIPANYDGLDAQLVKTDVDESFTEWHTISTQYISTGGEQYLTIGNFQTDANTNSAPGSGSQSSYFVYYYIDSVIVELSNAEELVIDLGEDIEICSSEFPVTLTSNIPNANNNWSNGQAGSSITVNSPGEYSIISNIGCSIGFDTINIIVPEDPDINLNDQTICLGETYTINLDQSFGDYLWNDGSQSSIYQINEPGSYSVTLTYDCGEIIEDFNIEVLDPILIPEVPNLELCEADLPYFLNFTQFQNGYNQFSWQDGSSNPQYLITSAGNYSLQIFNDCFSDQINFNVNIELDFPPPIPFTDTILCVGEQVFINTGISNADFVWQDGSTQSSFLASQAGIYSVEIINNCKTELYEYTILEAQQNTIDLGSDVALCPGDSVLLTAITDIPIINWNSGASGNMIWVQEEGQYIASANGLCNLISDTINITFNGTAPTINIPDSLQLCLGDSLIIDASNNLNGIEYSWNNGNTTSEILITESGQYTVEASNNCGSISDTILITEGESLIDPVFDNLYSICLGDTLNLSIDAFGADISWSNGSQDTATFFTQEGDYNISLTNSCTSKADSFRLEFLQNIENLDLGLDTGICTGSTIFIGEENIDGNYLWNNGSTNNQIPINEPGIYSLQISGICNTVIDSIEITDLGTIPEFDLGEDFSICTGDSILVDLTLEGFDQYSWSTGSEESFIYIDSAGTYILEAQNICGASADTISISINDEIPSIDLGEDLLICQGDTIELNLGNITGNISWNTGETGQSISVFDPGQFIAVAASSCGISSDTLSVEIIPELPNIDLGEDQTICFGESLEFDFQIDSDLQSVWHDNITGGFNFFTEATIIWFEISNDCGQLRDSVELQVIPLISDIELGTDTLICDQPNFEINSTNIDFNNSIIWSTNENTESITINKTGEYWVNISNDCFADRDSIFIEFDTAPTNFDLGPKDTICQGETLLLEGFQGDQFDYIWQDNSTNDSLQISQSGTYELTISNRCGSSNDIFELEVLIVEAYELPFQDLELCIGDSIQLDLGNITADNLQWSDGSNSRVKTFYQSGPYSIQLNTFCLDTLIDFNIFDAICSDNDLYIPNAFSPNNDGINDEFKIFSSENTDIISLKVSIYNRWGEQIFYSDELDFSWDGSYKSKSLNQGVYAYYLDVIAEVEGNEKAITTSGSITITK